MNQIDRLIEKIWIAVGRMLFNWANGPTWENIKIILNQHVNLIQIAQTKRIWRFPQL